MLNLEKIRAAVESVCPVAHLDIQEDGDGKLLWQFTPAEEATPLEVSEAFRVLGNWREEEPDIVVELVNKVNEIIRYLNVEQVKEIEWEQTKQKHFLEAKHPEEI